MLTAPLWFRAPFQLLRVFIKEELRDRVHVLRPSPGSRLASLSNPDPAVAKRDHFAWLNAAITETAPFVTTNSNEVNTSISIIYLLSILCLLCHLQYFIYVLVIIPCHQLLR